MCFFIGYFCLLIITANAIIKANVMIVTDTRPANSNFIIICKISISIIRLTSLLEANHICLFSFPMTFTIQYLHTYFKRTKQIFLKNFNTFLTQKVLIFDFLISETLENTGFLFLDFKSTKNEKTLIFQRFLVFYLEA